MNDRRTGVGAAFCSVPKSGSISNFEREYCSMYGCPSKVVIVILGSLGSEKSTPFRKSPKRDLTQYLNRIAVVMVEHTLVVRNGSLRDGVVGDGGVGLRPAIAVSCKI